MEEEAYPAALKESMTEEEEMVLVNQIVQSLGMDGNRQALPVILYCMCMWDGEDNAMEWFSKGVPLPIRMLNNNSWIPDFYKNQLCVLEALHGSEEPVEEPQCGCSLM